MPPKKETKKEAVLSEDDGTGILKNIVSFKFNFSITSINIPNIVIMYEWINAQTTERLDTGLIDQWNVVSQEAQANPDDPPIMQQAFEKVFDPIRITESLATILSTKKLLRFLYFVNADDMKVLQEFNFDYSLLLFGNQPFFEFSFNKLHIMEILDFKMTITADKTLLSDQLKKLLIPFQVEVVHVENIPIQEMKSYELAYVSYQFFDGTVVRTDPQVQMPNMYFHSKHVFLLGNLKVKDEFARKKLIFELHDKDEVVRNDIKTELQLFDIERWLQVEAEKEKPPEQDLIDPKTGKKIAKKDDKKDDKKDAKKDVKKDVKKDAKKDGKKKEVKLGEPVREAPAAKQLNVNNHGVAAMNLSAFVYKNVKEVDLLGQIFPRRVFEDTESHNLDLNTTARRNIPKTFTATNYFDNQAVMYVKFELGAPLR